MRKYVLFWKYLKKRLPKQERGGRPAKYERREILNAIFYLVRTGCAWRYLPREYPAWKTVSHYFREWRISGVWYKINHRLRRLVRKRAGKHRQASAAILDSQSVKTTETAREAVSFDNGKKVKGRKRHILVDTLGLLMMVCVHAAGISETAGGRRVLAELEYQFWRLKLIWVDGGYMNSLFKWVERLSRWRKIRIEQVKRSDEQTGFVVLPKRWIVELTFAWLSKQRRLSKDYESLCDTSEAMVHIAMIRLMLAKLDT
ncbi:MAG: IS5 family transposase [Pyrinomonadaceae bacterium]